jgi:hypothetical protein
MKHKMAVVLVTSTMFSAVGVVGLTATAAQASGPATEHVSMTGTDSGNCISSPCATINYAIDVAPAGTTIKVAAGTYDQTVDISKPVSLKGAGASSTTIDGAGLDPSDMGYYGVVYVGTTGGLTQIQGFTITNPYPDAYTNGEPEAVALADQSSSDSVDVVDDDIIEGSADSFASTDFPIGIDTLLNSAQTVILDNTISGFYQGAKLEDNGPATVQGNTFTDLIPNTASDVTYPAEGLFFLSDDGESLTGQNAISNVFEDYSGYGVAMDAGYSGGDCSPSTCNGSITGALTLNEFALTAGSPVSPEPAAIALSATGNGNVLTVAEDTDKGYVTSPSVGETINASSGGDVNYTENGTRIKEHG